jgi:hypothetical protein
MSDSSDTSEVQQPSYQVGDILVTDVHDGRSTFWYFYKVESLTRGGAPRVRQLETKETKLFTHPNEDAQILLPILEGNLGGPLELMRWYPSRGYYFTKEDARRTSHSGTYATTKLYEPGKEYKNHWLGD